MARTGMKCNHSFRWILLATISLLFILLPVTVAQTQDTPGRNPLPKTGARTIDGLAIPDQPFTPILGGIPDVLTFTYSIPDQQLLPAAHRVTPLNVGNDDVFTWTVSTQGGWLAVDRLTGATLASFRITPAVFGTNVAAFYTAVVTVTVIEPLDTENSPHRINLNLEVIDTSLNYAYLPLALRSYTRSYYPNDPDYDSQWAWEMIKAPAAWGYSKGQGVLIAVLDTGADLDHPDLESKVRTDIDYDFVNDDDKADDDHGHGTHVSGIAAAATNNGIGVAGMGWEAMVLPLKIISYDNKGDTIDLVTAIYYAADNGADVINMSVGGTTNPCCYCPASVQAAVDYAYSQGVVLVAASGSSGSSAEMFPANCEHVLGVAATDRHDARAGTSNYGNHVSVAAPGLGIYSTGRNGEYYFGSGTSMATPYVAGMAALLIARYPAYTPDEIASAILDNADDIGPTGWDPYFGCGRINAHRSLSQGKRDDSPFCLQEIGRWAADGIEASTAPFVPGEIIVFFQPGAKIETTVQQYKSNAEFLPEIGAWRVLVLPGQERAVLDRLRGNPAVAHVELNYRVFIQ